MKDQYKCEMKVVKQHLILTLIFLFSNVDLNLVATTTIVNIGAIISQEDKEDLETAFHCSVDRINRNEDILPYVRLQPHILTVPESDTFNTGRKVCEVASYGSAAVFGPSSQSSSNIVRSICETLEIPNVQFNGDTSKHRARTYINIHPDADLLAKAFVAVIKLLEWQSFTIIYDEEEDLYRLREVLKHMKSFNSLVSVYEMAINNDYRPMLKEIRESKETRILLHCSSKKILTLLKQARKIGMMDDYESYFLTSLDTHTIDLSEFWDSQMNITAIRMVNPSSEAVRKAFDKNITGLCFSKKFVAPHNIQLKSALLYDAVQLFGTAFDQIDKTIRVNIKPLNCDYSSRCTFGFALRKAIAEVEMEGLSGKIKFDENGCRTDFDLEVIKLTTTKTRRIGIWNSVTGITRESTSKEDDIREIESNVKNKVFVVASKIGLPYLGWKTPLEGRVGNDRFEGYSKDLIEEIGKEVNFKGYALQISPGNKQGSIDPKTEKWDGIMREVIDRKADLGVCDMTITYERGLAVDFTVPFMTTGISILYSKTKKKTPNLFSFLEPFDFDVWIYMATAYLGVSLALFLIARISPYEWINPHPCNASADSLENNLTLKNCLWHNIGSLMQQGSDIAPLAVSTRVVASLWWFFTLIMISSYTANLAAFLTITRMESPIKGAEDLAKQSKVKYGPMKNGSTARFFEKSDHSTYSKMWKAMQRFGPEVFAETNEDGVSKVQRGEYAFFMESVSIEYETERKCELAGIGGLLDSKGYGIALPRNSPYRSLINSAILRLSENGKLNELKNRWWIRKGGGLCNSTDKDVGQDTELGMQNVGGVFLVLVTGCFVSFLISMLEFLWKSRKVAIEQKITPWQAIVKELKFAASLHKINKPVERAQETAYANGYIAYNRKKEK